MAVGEIWALVERGECGNARHYAGISQFVRRILHEIHVRIHIDRIIIDSTNIEWITHAHDSGQSSWVWL